MPPFQHPPHQSLKGPSQPRQPFAHAPPLRLVNTEALPQPGVPLSGNRMVAAAMSSPRARLVTPVSRAAAAFDAQFPAAAPASMPITSAAIAAENRAASLSALDGRWALAVRTSQLLDGGRAAILSPERRHQLMSMARSIGLREFDASLVIAVVQDGARTGAGALSRDVSDRLRLIRPADPSVPRERVDIVLNLTIAALLGVCAVYVLAQWVLLAR